MRIQESCFLSMSGTTLSGAMWLYDVQNIICLIGAIISAIFGLVSLFILISDRLKNKADSKELTPSEFIKEIKNGAKEAEPYINQIKKAIDEYEKKQHKNY